MTNSSSCQAPQASWVPWVTYAHTCLLLVLGLPLNGLALSVFCCRLHRWTETHIYMVNLAVADLCVPCVQPFVLFSLKARELAPHLCHLYQGIYLANRYMSIALVMAIALDRYVAVRHPLRARSLRSPRQAAAVCAALWALVVGSLAVRGVLDVQLLGDTSCFFHSRQQPHTSVFSLLGFYVPLAVLLFCSVQVQAVLARRLDAAGVPAAATRRAARRVWASLLVFVLCFLPLHVVLTVQVALDLPSCVVWKAIFFSSKISDANCFLDAVCYYYAARELREASAQALSPRGQGATLLTLV